MTTANCSRFRQRLQMERSKNLTDAYGVLFESVVMSLFQCENCGCVENTSLSFQGFKVMAHCFDWKGKEHLNGKRICSACGPEKDKHGGDTECGKWHNQFKRTFLPLGMFKTNRAGNLEHKETGETNYKKYEIQR